MSFATRLANALAEENPAFYTAVSADFTTLQSSLDAELVTYGAAAWVRSWLDDQILTIAVEMSHQTRGRGGSGPGVGTPLNLETGYRLLLETGDNLLLEA